MKFKDIATVSGKSGLYKVLKPTRSGVILEALDDKKSKLVVGANQRVSVLSEISIYTTTEEGAVPLEEVMQKIEKEFQGDLGLDGTADADELKAFLKHVLPEFDESRVYASDIKKLVSWYGIIRKHIPEALEKEQEEEIPSEKKDDKKEGDN
jgi:methylglyoxal synthase